MTPFLRHIVLPGDRNRSLWAERARLAHIRAHGERFPEPHRARLFVPIERAFRQRRLRA